MNLGMTIPLELVNAVFNNQIDLINKNAPNELHEMMDIWTINKPKISIAKQYILSNPLVFCYIKINKVISYLELCTKPSIGDLFIIWFNTNIDNLQKNIIKVFNTMANNQIEKYSINKKSAESLLKILNKKDDHK